MSQMGAMSESQLVPTPARSLPLCKLTLTPENLTSLIVPVALNEKLWPFWGVGSKDIVGWIERYYLPLLFWVGSVCIFEKCCAWACRFVVQCCSIHRLGIWVDIQLIPRIGVEIRHGWWLCRIQTSKFENRIWKRRRREVFKTCLATEPRLAVAAQKGPMNLNKASGCCMLHAAKGADAESSITSHSSTQ